MVLENLLYTKEHEWILVDGDMATVGITDFAQDQLGDIVYVDIDCVGKEIIKDDLFGTIEAVKTVSDLFIPVSGVVLEKNSLLDSNPEVVNTDPYGDGWMVKIHIRDVSELSTLMSSEEYEKLVC